jgi:GTP-binding protein
MQGWRGLCCQLFQSRSHVVINTQSIRFFAKPPTHTRGRKSKNKHQYNQLREARLFPEPAGLLNEKIEALKPKVDPNAPAPPSDTPTPSDIMLTMDKQEALLKSLLRRGTADEQLLAQDFQGPLRKLLSPEMYQLFQESFIPYEVNPEQTDQARLFFTHNPRFIKSAATVEQLKPPKNLHQVVFVGRSNVGKSSLLNRLFGTQKKLVRVSGTPGFTRSVNYFQIGETIAEPRSIYLVDMPGYGYAQAPKKVAKQWGDLVFEFFAMPVDVQRRVFVLIDARLGIGRLDEELFAKLEILKIPYQVVLTKSDKISTEELRLMMLTTQQYLRQKYVTLAHPWIIPTSAQNGLGMGELKACICLCVGILNPSDGNI